MNKSVFEKVTAILESRKDRSKWNKAVTVYALELLDDLNENWNDWTPYSRTQRAKEMLNGAKDWSQYSWGGCSLIYDYEIAERLCTPSELKKTNGGQWKPNRSEDWLDVQARALYQASKRLNCAIATALRK